VLLKGLWVLGRAVRDEPRIFAVAVVGGIAFGLLTVASAYVIGAVVGRVVVPAFDAGRVSASALALGAAAILGVSLVKVCSIFGRRLGAGLMQFNLQATYRQRVTRRYLELPLAWHRRHATGTLLSNANADVEAAWFPIGALPFAVGTIFMIIAAVISLWVVDWTFAVVGLGVFPALLTINVIYSRQMAPRMARALALRAQTSAIAHESFDGALVIKAMGREAEETERFAARARELRDAMIRVGRLRGTFDPLLDVLPNVGTLVVLVVGVVRLRQGAISVEDIVSASFLFTVLAGPARAIGWVLSEVPRSVVGYERIERVLTATGDMVYGSTELPDAGPAGLRLCGVTFSYGGEPVLHGVSLEVPPGRTVALVGPTGSGKSTIAALAARLVDPAAGAVEVDDIDIRDLTASCLTRAVALVPQIPFVFNDTVSGNIALDRDGVDEPAVRSALRLAQAESFVDSLALGTEADVGERGTTLSGGQRQRLTLARAIAGRPRLLILDDATSAVDPRVEAEILRGLRERDGSASALVVAYRRATIALADEVVYLERGRVIARGTHERLLAEVDGYADLVTAYERLDEVAA
jgi:ABC-type multidrug transport system fused ATPase/permease subunit